MFAISSSSQLRKSEKPDLQTLREGKVQIPKDGSTAETLKTKRPEFEDRILYLEDMCLWVSCLNSLILLPLL